MKQFSRELQAARTFETAASNFRQVLGCDSDSPLVMCYDDFVGAVSGFILCELNMRQAERCLTAGIQQGRAADLRELSLNYNVLGIESLKRALERLGAAESTPSLTRAQKDELNSRIDEFGRNVTLLLVEEEIKPSDLAEILSGLKDVSKNARKGPSAILDRLRADISHLVRLRQSKDRGAANNIPGWKLAGLIVILGVFYVYYVRCIQQQNCTNAQKAFLLLAGVAGSILTGACE